MEVFGRAIEGLYNRFVTAIELTASEKYHGRLAWDGRVE
jgi:hypothetical protein